MKLMHSAKIGAIIPAAGRGQRMGSQGNKLFLELAGTPILLFTLKTFEACPYIQEIVIPAATGDIPNIRKLVRDNDLRKVSAIVEGGQERQESVAKAISALSPSIQRVVVHDGARPLLKLEDLNKFISEAESFEAAIMAVPLKDTIKKIDKQGWVVETPLREYLRSVQTPQLFSRRLLEKVHKVAWAEGYFGTDDASLVEWQGYAVKVLKGSYENIKVTTPEDLLLAEAILRKREDVKGNES
jgi:2-C-methyl-D-erythritol 4-phosphate cytidylyltransferase